MNLLSLIVSTDFVYMWIRVATPIIFASLGAVICTKAGVVNLGLEGIMLISALAGVLGSAFGGNLVWGVVARSAGSCCGERRVAYFHLVLKPTMCFAARLLTPWPRALRYSCFSWQPGKRAIPHP